MPIMLENKGLIKVKINGQERYAAKLQYREDTYMAIVYLTIKKKKMFFSVNFKSDDRYGDKILFLKIKTYIHTHNFYISWFHHIESIEKTLFMIEKSETSPLVCLKNVKVDEYEKSIDFTMHNFSLHGTITLDYRLKERVWFTDDLEFYYTLSLSDFPKLKNHSFLSLY